MPHEVIDSTYMNVLRKMHIIRHLPWIICFLVVAVVPGSAMADYIRIKGTVVNVRLGPGTSHQVLFQAEEGEEFDLLGTEGLWCHIRLQPGQEAWVFRKLVEVIPGERPDTPSSEKAPAETDSQAAGWTWVGQLGFTLFIVLLGVIVIWKRKKILRFAGVRLKEISGYKREQAFRYDNRKPSDDSWEL